MPTDRFRLIAFYLPQYHPIPENDAWWGKGFTEWTNVAKAKPLFPEHYQPHLPADLGFYDIRLPEARRAQAELARAHGIYGFCYYHYWFNGKLLLERPFNEVLASGEPDFPFCLCWANENWTRAWDGHDQNILIGQRYSVEDDRQHIHWLLNAFRDPRYIRINGKPLLLIYRISKLPHALQTASLWREEARKAGMGEIYLATVESLVDDRVNPTRIGFDAAVEFQPDWLNLGSPARRLDGGNSVYEYASVVDKALRKKRIPYNRFPCVTPGWDNTSRRVKNAYVFHGSTPELYHQWLVKVFEHYQPNSPEENLVFINAWNEWGEGAHLEPCQKWGRAYLEATRKALQGATLHFSLSQATRRGSRIEIVSTPKMSVCIPAYNGAAYVREAIASVLKQTFVDFELIVVDDCSTDGTAAQIRSFTDRRIRYVRNPSRLGLVGNWNRCIELSRSKYVCIFHQDDVMLPDNLEKKVKVLDESPNVGMIHSNVFQIDAAGNVLSRWWYFQPKPEDNGVHAGIAIFETLLSGPNIVCCPSAVVRKECYERLGGFDPQLPFTTDWEMWMRIAVFYDVAYLVEPLVKYRRHPGMETANFPGVKELEHAFAAKKAVLEKYLSHIPDHHARKLQVARRVEAQAKERAVECFRQQQDAEARAYLSFAAEMHQETFEQPDRPGTGDILAPDTTQVRSEDLSQNANAEGAMESDSRTDHLTGPNSVIADVKARQQRNGQPTVSVVIPCYNLGAYLDQAVQSVLNQTYDDFEIVIVDDGSTDPATQHLFASYQRPKTRILRTQNQGLAKARNFGIKAARGRYVSCLDADDLLEPDFLRCAVEILENNNSIVFASCWLKAFGEAHFSWNPTTCDFPHLLIEDTVCTAALMQRDAVLQVGGFDPNMPMAGYEDWDLAITLVKGGMRGVIIPEYLFRYRIRRSSMSVSCTEPGNHALLMRYLLEKHADSYNQYLPGVLDAIEKRTFELERGEQPDSTRDLTSAVTQRLTFLENTLSSVLQSRNWRLSQPLRQGFSRLQRMRRALNARKATSPRVTVVVNCGEDGEALRKTLDSLWFLQGCGGQLILMDDGSRDPLLREALAWYDDAGLKILRTPGIGSTRTREAGLRQAHAPIVFALNAGDSLEATAFQRAMEMLESDGRTAFVSYGFRDQRTGFVWSPQSAELAGLLACPRVAFPVLRREALLRVGGYDRNFSHVIQADWDLALRLAVGGERGTILLEPLISRSAGEVTQSYVSAEARSNRNLVHAVVEKHRVLFDSHWAQAVLGHENLRRQLQAYAEGVTSPAPSVSTPEPVDWGGLRRLEPVSPVWGIDRGQPIDRYYIGQFLHHYRHDIRGRVLEVKDAGYTRAYGQAVEISDVIDIAPENTSATIVGDLRDSLVLSERSYDCFILTQTLHIIYEMRAVVENAAKALRLGGVLLATLPCVSRVDYESGLHGDCWRVTPAAAKKMFEDVFGPGNVEVQACGNVLVSCGFLMGISSGELTPHELNHKDPYFPLLVCVRAIRRLQ